jgi:hypothetical protein
MFFTGFNTGGFWRGSADNLTVDALLLRDGGTWYFANAGVRMGNMFFNRGR